MMFTAAGSGQLGTLLTLMEYMGDPNNRRKEIKELIDATKSLEKERKSLAKAHGGAKKLDEAEKTLDLAQTEASNILSEANRKAVDLVANAKKKAGNLEHDRTVVDLALKTVAANRVTFDKTCAEIDKELVRREKRVTTSEKNVARSRDDVAQDKRMLHRRAENVAQAMKG